MRAATGSAALLVQVEGPHVELFLPKVQLSGSLIALRGWGVDLLVPTLYLMSYRESKLIAIMFVSNEQKQAQVRATTALARTGY